MGGVCTLNAAIGAANADGSVGSCPPGSGADTLVLTGDVPLSVVDNTLDGANGLPSVTSKISIEGNGYSVYRDTGASPPQFRIFHISPSGDLTLENLVVAFGVSDSGGGGIFNLGQLALRNSTVAFNTSSVGGGIMALYPSVTRIEQSAVSANLTTSFAGIYARPDGGGIFNSGQLTIVDSALTQNLAYYPGGGSSLAAGALGGAVLSQGPNLVISHSTLSNNSAISNSGYGWGGAVFSYGGRISNSTISGNTAMGTHPDWGARGGGLACHRFHPIAIEHTTFHGNQVLGTGAKAGAAVHVSASFAGGEVTVRGSVFSASTGDHCDGQLIDAGGGNLADDATCLPTIASTLTGLDPVLGDNGGPTATHALFPGSTALDVAGSCGVGTDQRGVGRMTPCDAGAFERVACGFLEIPSGVINFDSVLSTCHTIIVGPDVTVESPGSLDWTAGFLLNIKNGFVAGQGVDVTLGIDPSLLPP